MAVKKFMRQKTGKAVTCRDLANLKQKHKKDKLQGKTDVQDVLDELESALQVIANAVDFLIHKVIRNVTFDEEELNKHLLQCLVAGEITPFPEVYYKIVSDDSATKITTSVYCIGRLPEHYCAELVDCDACHEWYHKSCISSVLSNSEWFCPLCIGN
ncbi:hypothetical protein ONE63_003562 [Megalurothrips usitatus]|uniref:PHD-type domain-containing protein n=1 Tax=Megalurothrips usitatus TaxID=439358 RepID=A0AAV7X5W9_9NEOP|nr:hypothetical protein ONE63_003562 [Megalurothrips usitatus]